MFDTFSKPPQIAKRLQKDVHYVLEKIRSGELVAINLGKGEKRPRYVVAESDFQRFLDARKTRPPAPASRRRQRRAKPAAVDYVAMMRLGGDE
ncbi:MAG: helix-turn-helix domain-containing protein [Planctomycetaceae bacterium]|mgnify:CR=1 FL=1|nr:helix-turn-helix domain-containing protein [Planctomycetaceae bacterium]